MTGVLYLDASALVKLLIPEAESDALLAFSEANPRQVTSLLASVEVPRAIMRTGVQFGPRERAVLDQVTTITLGPSIVQRAARLPPAKLRSLDAIHLATALELGPELGAFVTYDARLADAAAALGLVVASPS